MIRRIPVVAFAVLVCASSPYTLFAENSLDGEIKVSPGIRPIDLIVYIANPPAGRGPKRALTAIMDQRNQVYHPHVLAILKGTTVKFQNSDRVTHNVFSFSPVKPFDLGKINPREHRQLTFDKAGVIEVLCGFHSHMSAYIRVMDHPYFAVPDLRGRFEIQNVSPGSYQLRIWHESLGEISREIKVTNDRRTPLEINFPR